MNKKKQRKLLTEIMKADEESGIYDLIDEEVKGFRVVSQKELDDKRCKAYKRKI